MSDFMTCPKCREEYLALGSAGVSNCPKCGARNVAPRLKRSGDPTGGGGLYMGSLEGFAERHDPAFHRQLLERRWKEDPKVRTVALVSFLIGVAVAIATYVMSVEHDGFGAVIVGLIAWGLAKFIVSRITGTSFSQWKKTDQGG